MCLLDGCFFAVCGLVLLLLLLLPGARVRVVVDQQQSIRRTVKYQFLCTLNVNENEGRTTSRIFFKKLFLVHQQNLTMTQRFTSYSSTCT